MQPIAGDNPLGGYYLPTTFFLLGGGQLGQEAWLFFSLKVYGGLCWPDFLSQKSVSYLEQTGSFPRASN